MKGVDVTFGVTARWSKHHHGQMTLLRLALSGAKAPEVARPGTDLIFASMQDFPARRPSGEQT
jgi:hypothetical protein